MKPRTIILIATIILSLIEFIIGMRILLRFFGASERAPFVSWIDQTSRPLIAPFEGMFPNPSVRGRFTIELSSLFALIAYGVVSYLLEELSNQTPPRHHHSDE